MTSKFERLKCFLVISGIGIAFFLLTIIVVFFFNQPEAMPEAKDEIPPTIELIGDKEVEILLNEDFQDPGYIFFDNNDPNEILNNNFTIDGNVNTSIPGIYDIKYSISDEAGNVATTTRIVKVLEKPSFETQSIYIYEKAIEQFIKDNNLKVSVGYYNFSKNYTFAYGQDVVYYGASLIKPVDALYAYQNMPLNGENKRLVKLAISISDKDAHMSLCRKIGGKNFVDFENDIGIKISVSDKRNCYGDTNVSDQLILWKYLWRFINSNENGEELKSYFMNDRYNFIAKNIDENSLHKYGWYGSYFHDVGIILADSPYIIIVLTKEGYKESSSPITVLSDILYNFNSLVSEY